MKRLINPELNSVRVYGEKGMAVICVKKQPSIPLTYSELQQLQYLLSVEPGLLDTAAYLLRELGSENAFEKLKKASDKLSLETYKEDDNGSYYGV